VAQKDTDTHIAGKAAIWLGLGSSIIAIVIAVVNGVRPGTIHLSEDITLTFLLVVLTLIATYVYGRIEHIATMQDRVLAQPVQGIEVFHSADELLARLAEVTVGASTVSTLNLSPPRGASPPLDDYFLALAKYLHSVGTPLRSFRSLAHISDAPKAKWVVDRAQELAPTGKFSQAIFNTGPRNVFPAGFHVVAKGDDYYVFIYPGISLTGMMQCFMIKNEQLYGIMLGYFDSLWSKALIIHEGKNFYDVNLTKLKDLAHLSTPVSSQAANLGLAHGATEAGTTHGAERHQQTGLKTTFEPPAAK
jgi:hypothetical protein